MALTLSLKLRGRIRQVYQRMGLLLGSVRRRVIGGAKLSV